MSIDGFDISSKIKSELKKEMRLSALDINVDTKDGFVTLGGIVDTLAEKRAAEEIVTKIPGVKGIDNLLAISTDGYITDKDTEAEIINILRNSEHNEGMSGVSVKVKKGTAILFGSVDTLREKKRAVNEAEKVMGVKDILTKIKISSSGQYDDDSIANKITQRFSETDLSIPDILTDVRDGVVRISGHVDDRHQMEAAIEIAEEVEGVTKVINALKTRKGQ